MLVAVLGFPLLVGPVAGGWIAGRRSGRPVGLGTLAGLLGGLPWAALAALAVLGALPQWGYHTDLVHVGINPAPPGMFGLPVAVSIGAAMLLTSCVLGAAGGLVVRARPAVESALANGQAGGS